MTNLSVSSSMFCVKGSLPKFNSRTKSEQNKIRYAMRVSYLFKVELNDNVHTWYMEKDSTKEHVPIVNSAYTPTHTRTIYGTYNLKVIASIFIFYFVAKSLCVWHQRKFKYILYFFTPFQWSRQFDRFIDISTSTFHKSAHIRIVRVESEVFIFMFNDIVTLQIE